MHCRTINSERQWTGQCTQHGRCSRWFLSGVGISMRGNNCKTRTCTQGKIECSHGQHGSATFIHVEKDDHVYLMEETVVIVTLLESVTDQELDKRVETKMRGKDSSIGGMTLSKTSCIQKFGAVSKWDVNQQELIPVGLQ